MACKVKLSVGPRLGAMAECLRACRTCYARDICNKVVSLRRLAKTLMLLSVWEARPCSRLHVKKPDRWSAERLTAQNFQSSVETDDLNPEDSERKPSFV